jgi:hypothetical protein
VSFHHAGQDRPALGGRPERGDQSAAQHHRGEVGLDYEMPAERLHEDRELDRAATIAAVLGRKRQAEPTELGELRPDLAAEARFARRDPLERTVVVALAKEFLGALAQEDVFAVVSKVHDAHSLRSRRDIPHEKRPRGACHRRAFFSSTDRRSG